MAVSAAVGALAAGAYAHFIGCRTGGCALLSNVWTAAVAGGLVGLALSRPSPAPGPAPVPGDVAPKGASWPGR